MPIDDIIAETTGASPPGTTGGKPTLTADQQQVFRTQRGFHVLDYDAIKSRFNLDRENAGFIATVVGLLMRVVEVI